MMEITYQAAPKVLDEFIISKKELSVNIKVLSKA